MFFLRNYKTVIFVTVLLIIALVMLSYNVKYDTGGGVFQKNRVRSNRACAKSFEHFRQKCK